MTYSLGIMIDEQLNWKDQMDEILLYRTGNAYIITFVMFFLDVLYRTGNAYIITFVMFLDVML